MSEISVLVPHPISALIEARVASGEFASASDYVTELVLLDQPLSTDDATWLSEFDASIGRGIADSRASHVVDADVVLAELEARYAAMKDPASE
jgi:Arc/MetJ-type ribon-helix-helix transcriptional regulator